MSSEKYTVPCKGIIASSQHDWKFEDLLTREPREDEFLVEMIATGVCHTDISGYGGIYPRVLGHEGAGRILKLGSEKQRKTFKEGDLVILSAAACLDCHYCTTGHPAYCVDHAALTLAANEPNFALASDPTKIIGGGYFGQSSFASPVPVKISCAANVTKLVRDAQELKKYAPLGCGIMTGAGAITHVGKCQPDDVVAVIGLGGVGLAGICAAKERGVKTIIAVDLLESRINLAKEMGATISLLSTKEGLKGEDLSAAIKKLTPGGLGCTHILDTTPSVAILSQCLEALQKNGTVLQVGVKPVGTKLEVDTLTHMVQGRRLVGVIEGDRDPVEALPELVEWAKSGVLPVEKMLKEFPVKSFEEARSKMEDGSVIKSVLIW
ncbi:putative alcohol dehydrogenase [Paraphoma chrysanthemicola]|uniref:Alcohol dehydrogenase n=1 Tax=Paraphoma chrysanthemicola TaxID=798071 RepID=A0A8K0RHT3_9PLEO|nr:putative alcohol dehydrogenase [Paraphoma chrysanthemicola]